MWGFDLFDEPKATEKGERIPPNPRQECNLVGLSNQGATCYLNSLIQSLYMTPEFRRGLFNMEETTAPNSDGAVLKSESPLCAMGFSQAYINFAAEQTGMDPACEQLVDWMLDEEHRALFDATAATASVRAQPVRKKRRIIEELRHLFAFLQKGDNDACSTQALTESFGWSGSQVTEQHDVQELNRVLFDALERTLRGTTADRLIPSLYGGVKVWKTQCLECMAISEREETFQDLSVVVEGCSTLEDSLTLSVGFEDMPDAGYKCDACGRAVGIERSSALRRLPPLLIFSLSRFTFDLVKFRRSKVNTRLPFPATLDMAPYLEDADRGAIRRRQEVVAAEAARRQAAEQAVRARAAAKEGKKGKKKKGAKGRPPPVNDSDNGPTPPVNDSDNGPTPPVDDGDVPFDLFGDDAAAVAGVRAEDVPVGGPEEEGDAAPEREVEMGEPNAAKVEMGEPNAEPNAEASGANAEPNAEPNAAPNVEAKVGEANVERNAEEEALGKGEAGAQEGASAGADGPAAEGSAKEETPGKAKGKQGNHGSGLYQPKVDEGSEWLYDLFSVVVHRGGAQSGHYHAYIRDWLGEGVGGDGGGHWFNFNDATVRPVDAAELATQYGAVRKQESSYMLMYRARRAKVDVPGVEWGDFSPVDLPKDLEAEVEVANRDLEQERAAYDKKINAITVKVHTTAPYKLRGDGALIRLEGDGEAGHSCTIDKRAPVREWLASVEGGAAAARVDEVVGTEGGIVLLRTVFDLNDGDSADVLDSSLEDCGVRNKAEYLAWDGASVNGVPYVAPKKTGKPAAVDIAVEIVHFDHNISAAEYACGRANPSTYTVVLSNEAAVEALADMVAAKTGIAVADLLMCRMDDVMGVRPLRAFSATLRDALGGARMVSAEVLRGSEHRPDSVAIDVFEARRNGVSVTVVPPHSLDAASDAATFSIQIDRDATVKELKVAVAARMASEGVACPVLDRMVMRRTIKADGFLTAGAVLTAESKSLSYCGIDSDVVLTFDEEVPESNELELECMLRTGCKKQRNAPVTKEEPRQRISIDKNATVGHLLAAVAAVLHVDASQHRLRLCDDSVPKGYLDHMEKKLAEAKVTKTKLVILEHGRAPSEGDVKFTIQRFIAPPTHVVAPLDAKDVPVSIFSPAFYFNQKKANPREDVFFQPVGVVHLPLSATVASLRAAVAPLCRREAEAVRLWGEKRLLNDDGATLKDAGLSSTRTITVEVVTENAVLASDATLLFAYMRNAKEGTYDFLSEVCVGKPSPASVLAHLSALSKDPVFDAWKYNPFRDEWFHLASTPATDASTEEFLNRKPFELRNGDVVVLASKSEEEKFPLENDPSLPRRGFAQATKKKLIEESKKKKSRSAEVALTIEVDD